MTTSGNTNDKPTAGLCRVEDLVGSACNLDCALGDFGHCGRTKHEFLHHCEKRFNAKQPQRGEAQPNATHDRLCD